MPDSRSKKPRFKERDDDDDDRPRKRRKSRDEDDDEDDDEDVRPKRKGKKGGSSLPLLLGGGALLALILGCCGVGSYFAFFAGGSSPLGLGNHFTLNSANLQSGGRNSSTVAIDYSMNAGIENTEDYWVVVKIGGKKYDAKMLMLFTAPGGKGSQGVLITGLTGTAPPYEVWIEKRPPGGSAKVVSNTISVR
jgi:hypothetical protein